MPPRGHFALEPAGAAAYFPCPTGGAAAFGVIAQLGERYNGIVEVVGSIPTGSTSFFRGFEADGLGRLVRSG